MFPDLYSNISDGFYSVLGLLAMRRVVSPIIDRVSTFVHRLYGRYPYRAVPLAVICNYSYAAYQHTPQRETPRLLHGTRVIRGEQPLI